jgi:hypothetical protein
VNGALVELAAFSFRGQIVRRLRLLRQPRYLISSLAGLAYFLFFVGRQLGGFHRRGGLPPMAPELGGDILPLVIGLAFASGATLIWAFASAKPALRLSEAEIHFLLPAPLTRREILAYALWKQQIGVFFGALILALVRGAGPPGQRLARFFATWALLTLVDLHLKGVSLWKARLAEIPASSARLQVGAVATAAAAFWALLAGSLWRTVRAATSGTRFDLEVLRRIAAAAAASLPGRLLAPFAWIGRPLFGDLAGGWAALYLLLLLAAHAEWVLRSRGRFEEAALSRARRQLERGRRRGGSGARPAALSSRLREPFALSPAGRPELAIFWKNLTQRSRLPLGWRAALLAAPPVVLLAVTAALGAPPAMVGTLTGLGLTLLVTMPALCGLFLRNDLRTDLREIETLRPWPIAGRSLITAELLAPAISALALLGSGYGLLLAAGLAAGLTNREALITLPGSRWASPLPLLVCGYGSLLVVGLAVALLSIALQNLAVLTLPAWLGTAPQGRRGAAVTGQRVLVFFGHLLGLVAGLFVPALLVGAVLLAQWGLGIAPTIWEGPLLALLVVLPVVAEVALLVRLGGARWDRLDPSREILEREE